MVTVKKWVKQSAYKEGAFILAAASELSVHAWLVLLLWACGGGTPMSPSKL